MWWIDPSDPANQYDAHYWAFCYNQHDYHVRQWKSNLTRQFLESMGFRVASPPRPRLREEIQVQPMSKPVPLWMTARYTPKTA